MGARPGRATREKHAVFFLYVYTALKYSHGARVRLMSASVPSPGRLMPAENPSLDGSLRIVSASCWLLTQGEDCVGCRHVFLFFLVAFDPAHFRVMVSSGSVTALLERKTHVHS